MQTLLERINRLGKYKLSLLGLAFVALFLFLGWLGFRRARAQFTQHQTYLPVFYHQPQRSASPAPTVPPSVEDPPAVPNEYLILWKPDTPVDETAVSRPTTSPPNTPIVEIINLSQLARRGESQLADDILEEYRRNPDVLAVEPNYIYTLDAVPTDPDLTAQYAWETTQAYAAWDVTEGSPDVIIAIIDTGIQTDHPDLDSKLVPGYNFVRDSSDANDDHGHGTHVAGTAAAETNNGSGGAGFCPGCRLMPIKVLASNGAGSLANVIQGILFAVDNGATVINLSLGGGSSTALEQVIDYAWSRGIFVTCAAGNSSASRIYYPAGYDNCISVGATNRNDQRANFSNYGTWVDLAAPGVDIFSSYLDGRYANLNGTSMAAPHVAGLAGLLASQGLSNDQIRETLCRSADNTFGTGSAWRCGRINAAAALAAAPPVLPTSPPPTLPPPPSTATPPVTNNPPPSNPAPQPTPTAPLPTAVPPNPNSALQNGRFESGESGWTVSESGLIRNVRPRTGSLSAALGGQINALTFIEQTVSVPENGRLTFYWYADGQNDMGDRLQLEITILDANARYSLSMNATSGHWYERTVSLGHLAGRTVRLRFTSENNGFYPTTFYLDDVTLQ